MQSWAGKLACLQFDAFGNAAMKTVSVLFKWSTKYIPVVDSKRTHASSS